MRLDFEKAASVLSYFASREVAEGRVNKLKAIKLFFFADRFHLRRYGRLLCGGRYVGMNYGPVNSPVKDLAERSEFLDNRLLEYAERVLETAGHDIVFKNKPDFEQFSKSDIEAMEKTWDIFGKFDGFTLAKISHAYPEWLSMSSMLNVLDSFEMNLEGFFCDPSEEGRQILYKHGFTEDPFKEDLDRLKLMRDFAEEFGLIKRRGCLAKEECFD